MTYGKVLRAENQKGRADYHRRAETVAHCYGKVAGRKHVTMLAGQVKGIPYPDALLYARKGERYGKHESA